MIFLFQDNCLSEPDCIKRGNESSKEELTTLCSSISSLFSFGSLLVAMNSEKVKPQNPKMMNTTPRNACQTRSSPWMIQSVITEAGTARIVPTLCVYVCVCVRVCMLLPRTGRQFWYLHTHNGAKFQESACELLCVCSVCGSMYTSTD